MDFVPRIARFNGAFTICSSSCWQLHLSIICVLRSCGSILRSEAVGLKAFSTLPHLFSYPRPPLARATAPFVDSWSANYETCLAESCDASAATTLAHARRARHRPREPVLRLGPRSSH